MPDKPPSEETLVRQLELSGAPLSEVRRFRNDLAAEREAARRSPQEPA